MKDPYYKSSKMICRHIVKRAYYIQGCKLVELYVSYSNSTREIIEFGSVIIDPSSNSSYANYLPS